VAVKVFQVAGVSDAAHVEWPRRARLLQVNSV